jgi:hypothetical protein
MGQGDTVSRRTGSVEMQRSKRVKTLTSRRQLQRLRERQSVRDRGLGVRCPGAHGHWM